MYFKINGFIIYKFKKYIDFKINILRDIWNIKNLNKEQIMSN